MLNIYGRVVNRFVGRFQERRGIERTRKLAKLYDNVRYGHIQRRAIVTYQNEFAELLSENEPGFTGKPRNKMQDGWAIDRSGNFPGIEETLRTVDTLISSRGEVDRRGTSLAQTDWLFHLNNIK